MKEVKEREKEREEKEVEEEEDAYFTTSLKRGKKRGTGILRHGAVCT